MNAQNTELDTMTAAFDDSKELYFTFNEGNGELSILKVAADKAATLNTSELSYYGGKWEGPKGYGAVVAEIDGFIENEVEELLEDNADADYDAAEDAVRTHYLNALDAAMTIDEFEPGSDIWDLRGEDEDDSLRIVADDVRKMLSGKE